MILFNYIKTYHLTPLVIPKKSSKILSFYSNFRYLFSFGASIWITFIFLMIYRFLSLLVYKEDPLDFPFRIEFGLYRFCIEFP
jgi:hypothetical protein